MTMKFDPAMNELKLGGSSTPSPNIIKTSRPMHSSIANLDSSLPRSGYFDLDQDLFEAKGSPLHRYRSLELLEEAARHLHASTEDELSARNDIISHLRTRWEPVYRIHKEDWPSIYRQLDQYDSPTPKKPSLKKSTRALRRFIEGVMWVADTGAKWSYLPRPYGRWQVSQERFLKWLDLGYWDGIVRCLSNKDQRNSLNILMENHYSIRRSNALASMILGRKTP